jgi:hypothetical protein
MIKLHTVAISMATKMILSLKMSGTCTLNVVTGLANHVEMSIGKHLCVKSRCNQTQPNKTQLHVLHVSIHCFYFVEPYCVKVYVSTICPTD